MWQESISARPSAASTARAVPAAGNWSASVPSVKIREPLAAMFARHFCGYSGGRFLPEFHYDCRRMAVIPLRLVITILALAALGGMRAAAAADSFPIEILKAEVGYDGVYKSGFWTPIWLTIRAPR